MTRDEAIKMFAGSTGNNKNYAALMVNGFVNLGMLKLDEPQSAEDVLAFSIIENRCGTKTAENILRALDISGLKIVEK